MQSKKILMITTGGTIASGKTENGLAPLHSGAQLLSYLPQLTEQPHITVRDVFDIDSTDMTTEMRLQIAAYIWQRRGAYDGFVVVHGTDTLAYTAAFLYHALENFPKPVIITGAQEPISAPKTDAVRNLADAIQVACTNYFGVAAVFGGRIMHGSCVYKYHTKDYDAFRSIGREDDGYIENGRVYIVSTPEASRGEPFCRTKVLRSVGVIPVFPDLKAETLRAFAVYDALIMEAYGSGGMQHELQDAAAFLLEQGTRVYMASQCMEDGVQLDRYAVGSRALELGLVALGNTTMENAIAEIMFGKR